jgi:hypothetical protein
VAKDAGDKGAYLGMVGRPYGQREDMEYKGWNSKEVG